MNAKNPSLKEMLLEDLNPAFVKALVESMPSLYADSFDSMMNDPNLGEAQAKVVLGHYRRGRAETLFEQLSGRYGVKYKTVQPEGGGCSHIQVQIGRFQLAMCHVVSRDAFPQHSDDRAQSAKVNECLAQLSLLSEEVKLTPGEIYGIIIHTETTGKKKEFSSIKIGIPNHDRDGWAEEPIDLLEIMEIQSMRHAKQVDLQGQIQTPKAKPTWKKPSQNEQASND